MRMKRQKAPDEIPTSSMADIAFLLIVYFMLTATFAATRGLDFALPQDDDTPPMIEREDSTLIEVQVDASYRVDDRPMQLSELMDYLQPILERNPFRPVILRSLPEAPYGAMVAAFDELRQGQEKIGVEINISIPTQREIDQFWY